MRPKICSDLRRYTINIEHDCDSNEITITVLFEAGSIIPHIHESVYEDFLENHNDDELVEIRPLIFEEPAIRAAFTQFALEQILLVYPDLYSHRFTFDGGSSVRICK